MLDLKDKKIGFAICGSFCTFSKAFEQLERLVEMGADVTAIMSFNAAYIDTRFGKSQDHIELLSKLTGKRVMRSIAETEPVGPKRMFDALVIAPCTGNTLAKLAVGIVDTPVTMAAKSHLRNGSPLIIALSTNDGLAGAAKNIGALLNYRHVYFVPFAQDDADAKPRSLSTNFSLIPEAISAALEDKQLQPVINL